MNGCMRRRRVSGSCATTSTRWRLGRADPSETEWKCPHRCTVGCMEKRTFDLISKYMEVIYLSSLVSKWEFEAHYIFRSTTRVKWTLLSQTKPGSVLLSQFKSNYILRLRLWPNSNVYFSYNFVISRSLHNSFKGKILLNKHDHDQKLKIHI